MVANVSLAQILVPQLEQIVRPQPVVAVPEPAQSDQTNPDEVVPVRRKPSRPLGPRSIRLHLDDGSVIGGELSVEAIAVETEFGTLAVPIAKIRSFTPGLDSKPDLSKQVGDLIEKLGSDDYQTREQAHKALVAMGLNVIKELQRHKDDENAERKQHIQKILKQFEELAEEQHELEDSQFAKPSWIRQDTVVTTEFTMVGKISPAEFNIASRYGTLTVKLADVGMAKREAGAAEPIQKKVTVTGNHLAQRGFMNSGIRVQRGDRVSIKADGQLVMSPWGGNQVSTPDGGQNYGWYIPNKICGGALIAKIGSSGKVFKVGSKHSFVATGSGRLQFAVAMQQQFAAQGHAFPGQYNVSIRVEPQ